MSTLKRLVVAIVLVTLAVPFDVLQAQEPGAEPDIDAAVAEWAALDAHAWHWDSCGLHMEGRVAQYEAELAEGLTEAESLAGWCLEQRAEAYAESHAVWRNLRAQFANDAGMDVDDETLATKCSCVCALSSAADCALCVETPTDPAMLALPGVCHCIVAH